MKDENCFSEINVQSLYELNLNIKRVLSGGFPQLVWVRAELSDVRYNQNGHCYLEFIEKDSVGRNVIARTRGVIWSNTFKLLKAYFEAETGQQFTSGLKVMVEVSIDFHENYGLSLTVHGIDPSYTLGDQARNRQAIIKQLEEDGVIDLNKELAFSSPTTRIAIISSPTAAGYEDFLKQLNNNVYGFKFYTKLFPAIMQGERTEESVISALERIYNYLDNFDVVTILRGGGATSELSSFDSYLLAANCAQFPLPIVTGIGHERDETVLDIVAHTRAKTPTAVAEFLINLLLDEANLLSEIEKQIVYTTNSLQQKQMQKFEGLASRFSYLTKGQIKEQIKELDNIAGRLKNLSLQMLDNQRKDIVLKEEQLRLLSPETILKKGYTLTLKDKKPLKSVTELKSGDEVSLLFKDGQIESIIK